MKYKRSKYKLYHADCLEQMRVLSEEDVKVDLILTDPPYLMNYKTSYRKDKTHEFCTTIKNDNNPQLIHDSIPLLYDLLNGGGALYMFCNADHVDYFKQEVEKYFHLKNILIWIKNNHTAGDLQGAYAKKTEFIIYACKGRHILNGKRDVDTLYYDRVCGDLQLHQNQKPLDLLEFLIEKSSQEGDTVLDCFMGSGSTGVACMNTRRDFIGIELEEKYYQIAEKRISDANKQTKLF